MYVALPDIKNYNGKMHLLKNRKKTKFFTIYFQKTRENQSKSKF